MISLAHRLFSVLFLFIALASAHRRGLSPREDWLDQIQFTATHNSIRASHGANALSWSDTLAQAAENWAQACDFQYASGTLDDGTAYGQNVMASTGSVSAIEAVNAFANDRDSAQLDPETFTHFTQLVWKGTTEVGCARYTKCSDVFDSTAASTTLVACFYSPPGNIIGQISDNVEL